MLTFLRSHRDAGFKAGDRGSIYHGTAVTHLEGAMEYTGERRSHRVIILSGTKQADKNRVTVSELEMLISWMNRNMGAQTLALGHKGVSSRRFHMVFPVCFCFSFPFRLDYLFG